MSQVQARVGDYTRSPISEAKAAAYLLEQLVRLVLDLEEVTSTLRSLAAGPGVVAVSFLTTLAVLFARFTLTLRLSPT